MVTCPRPTQAQVCQDSVMNGGRVYKTPLWLEKFLAVDCHWGKESHFPLVALPLKSYSCLVEWQCVWGNTN